MEVLTLHQYSRKSDEFSTTSGSAIPVNATSLHVNLLSPEDCSYISSSATETPQTGGASLVQSLRRSQGLKCVDGSTCVDEPSMGAPACQNSFFNKKFVIPIQLDWTLEGNMLGEYFGLAMAVCAVGLLRSACLGSEGTNAKFSKEGTLSMVGKTIFAPLELLMQRSSAEAKQGRKIQVASGTVEQSSLLQKINQLQGELLEVKRLRSEDGKANERVVSIFASKEQAWKAETRKFRDDQQMLCQELQRAYLQIDALNLKLEQPRGLQEETCSECEHREGLFAELKERFGEQEFLVMATMEEAQIEQQEKNVLAEKLASTESLLSQMEEKLSLEAERHALELEKHKDLLEQLQIKLKEAEVDHSQTFQDLRATQASLSTVIHEKCCCEEHVQKMSTEITLLKRSVQGKDDIVSAMVKKAKADNEDRKELERELAAMKIKLCNSEMEKEKLRRHMESSTRSSFRTENPRFRNSFGGRPMPNTRDMTEEMQKLHDAEIRNLHSTYEEQVQMLQKRLTLYQERVADLEEDILLRMTQANRMITYKEHDGSSEHQELIDNNYMTVLKESLEAELATKQFQLSVAKTLINQLTESEAYREQEAENWKKLYLASKTAVGIHKEKEQAGAIVSKNPELPDRLELEKSRYTYKLEQRHWQVIDAFERQMKARDERMEAFRVQLVHMEDEMQRSHRQIEALKQSLVDANEEKQRLEELLQQKDRILACRRTLLGGNTNSSCEEDHQKKPCSLWEKVSVLQALPTEKKRENDESFISALTVSESEQQDRDSKLAVVEAQLVQVHINFEKERKEKEKLLLELQTEKSALEHYFNVGLNNKTKKKLPVLAYKACSALKRLSTIHEAQAQLAFPADSLTEEHVKELIEQSAQYTASYPEVSSVLEETGYVSSKSRKVCVSGKSQKVVDDGFTVDKFVAEVQPCGMV